MYTPVKFFSLLILILFLTGCAKDHSEKTDGVSYQQIAWMSLSENQKLSVTTEWKNAVVEKTTYKNKKVYAVSFHTVDDALLGPLVIFIDRSSSTVLGHGFQN